MQPNANSLGITNSELEVSKLSIAIDISNALTGTAFFYGLILHNFIPALPLLIPSDNLPWTVTTSYRSTATEFDIGIHINFDIPPVVLDAFWIESWFRRGQDEIIAIKELAKEYKKELDGKFHFQPIQ